MNTHSIDLELTSSQYLWAADSASLSITGDLTLECWVKLESQPAASGAMHFIGKYDGDVNNSWGFFYFNVAGEYRIYFQNSADGNAIGTTYWVKTITTGEWTHIALSYKASTGAAILYVNGVAEAEQTGTLKTSLYNGNAKVTLGAAAIPGQYLDGLIDEGRVWNDIRTPTEITDNKSVELNGDEAGLAAYWKLNNGLLDETTNNNDLTAVNTPVFSADVPFVGAAAGGGAFFFANL